MPYDNLCKYLAERYPHQFASWLLGEPVSAAAQIEVLKTELSHEPVRADAVLLLEHRQIILHIEFQTASFSRPPLPLRMLDYWVRLHRQHELPIEQFVVFLRETNENLTNEFRAQNTWHRYNVVKLWEQEKEAFLENLGLLPLAPLTRADVPAELLTEVAERTRQLPLNQEKSNLLMQVALLAGLRFTEEVIMNALREDILQESSVYQYIIQQGLQEGRQQGMQQGMQQGKAETLIRLLKHRLANLSVEDEGLVAALNLEQLDKLTIALLDFHQVSDLEHWLAQNSYQM